MASKTNRRNARLDRASLGAHAEAGRKAMRGQDVYLGASTVRESANKDAAVRSVKGKLPSGEFATRSSSKQGAPPPTGTGRKEKRRAK